MFGLFLSTWVYLFQTVFADASSWEAFSVAVRFLWAWFVFFSVLEGMGMLAMRGAIGTGKRFWTRGRVLKLLGMFLILFGTTQARGLVDHFQSWEASPNGAVWIFFLMVFLGLSLKRKANQELSREGLSSFMGGNAFRFQSFGWPTSGPMKRGFRKPGQERPTSFSNQPQDVIEVESVVISSERDDRR